MLPGIILKAADPFPAQCVHVFRSNRFWLFLIFLALLAIGGVFLWRDKRMGTGESVTINGITVPPIPALLPEEVAKGEVLYNQYCASCHGIDLAGAPDWKTRNPDGTLPPPPHDSSGHTWHHSDALLMQIIADGGLPENGNMPAFKTILTDDEINLTLSYIKSTWGEEEREYQWWISYTQDSFNK